MIEARKRVDLYNCRNAEYKHVGSSSYFPPPNGATAAGDAHFAKEENWKNLSGLALSPGVAPATGTGNLTSVHGRSGHLDSSAGIRISELQVAASLLRAPLAAPIWSVRQAEFLTAEMDDATATAAEKNAGWRDRLEMQRSEQPQRAASTSLMSVTVAGSTESAEAISKHTSRHNVLLAAWDEVLLNWPAAERSLADLLHVEAT